MVVNEKNIFFSILKKSDKPLNNFILIKLKTVKSLYLLNQKKRRIWLYFDLIMSGQKRYFFILILSFLYLARGQVPFPGTCPEVKVLETFDLERYMGTWYEYSKYPFVFEAGQKCQQAVYTNLGNNTISVVNTGVYIIVNKPSSTTGSAKVLAPGQLAVSLGNQKSNTANYLVLDTDYTNYAVVFSCRSVTSYGHAKLLWILTRQRQPPEEAIQLAMQVIKRNKLSETFLMKSTQTDCADLSETNTEDDQIAAASSTTADDENSLDFSSTSTERVIETA